MNAVLVTFGMALIDGMSGRVLLAEALRVFPAFAVNVLLFASVAYVYSDSGDVGVLSALLLVALFSYLLRLTVAAQADAQQIRELGAEREDLLHDLLSAEERERRRVAERLHDAPLQDILAAQQDVRQAMRGREGRLQPAIQALQSAAEGVRDLVSELYPVSPSQPFGAEVRGLAELHGARGDYTTTVDLRASAPPELEPLLLSALRELLSDVTRHANANVATVRVDADDGRVTLLVEDDGVGPATSGSAERTSDGHIGLAALTARVKAAGGTVSIGTRSDGTGCVATVTVGHEP